MLEAQLLKNLDSFDIESIEFNLNDSGYRAVASQQKKVDVTNGDIAGIEVYGRLEDKKGNSYPPALFIPKLIESNQLASFTSELFNTVINDWLANTELDEKLSLTFNLDLTSLSDPATLLEFQNKAKDFSPYTEVFLDICLEQFLSADKAQIENVMMLRECGYKIAIELDDYSDELEAVLADLPISEVKLKHRVLNGPLSKLKIEQTLSPIILIASKYSIPVTLIGVETEAEFDLIKDSGLTYIQGYFFGKEENNNEVISNALTQISSQSQKHTTGKLICFSNNSEVVEVIKHLFETKKDKKFYPLSLDSINTISIDADTIILFDLNDSDDIVVAKEILSQFEQEIISLVMLPKTNSPEVKVGLFDLGSYDVIEKPISPIEVITKIERMSSFLSHREKILGQLQETESLAMQSMQDASSYGEIVRFMKNVSTCTSDSDLSRVFFNYMAGQGLNCSIFFTDNITDQAYSSHDGICSPTEFKLFKLLREQSRLHEFGNRLLVNDKNVSFLIKNMPTDEALRGRIRDYVAVVVECLQEKQFSIIKSQVIQDAVVELAEISNESMDVITKSKERRKSLIEQVCTNISKSFHELDLSLEQEDYLTGIIRSALDASEADDISINNLVSRVNEVTAKLEETSFAVDRDETEAPQDEDDADMSVELF